MGKIPLRTREDCRSTSERKRRTHTYHDLVDLVIELALKRENDSHMEKFLQRHLGKGANPTPDLGASRGSKTPTNPNKGGGKGGDNLRAMNEVEPEAGVPHSSTPNLSMTRGGLVMPLTAIIAVGACCN